MTIPSYSTDLTLLDDCNTDTGYSEPSAAGWTQLNAESFGETDLFIQGTTCISATCKTGVGATLFDNASGVTIPADGAFLIWAYFAAPNSLDIEANGGIRTVIGDTNSDFRAWTHGGSDTYTYGGWINLATNPTVSPDYTEGSPATTYRWFGWAYNALSVPSKGNPYCVDAMRYGRCEARFQYGDATDYCTFSGFAALNDANDVTNGYNRWGLIQEAPGGFLWKGMMNIGYNSVAADFRDSNALILVDNTKAVTPRFNKIEIRTSSTRVDWTSISFQALGKVSRGDLEVVDSVADVNFESCSFTDMGDFIFGNNSTINNCTFRRCGPITTNSGVFNTCVIDSCISGSSMVVDAVNNITDCSFYSAGLNHAVEATTPGDYNWNNYLYNYATTSGSTGNEAFYNNSGGHINLTYAGGTQPHVRNGTSATTTIIIPSVLLTISAPVTLVGAEIRIYDYESAPPDFGTELAGVESHDSATYVYNGTASNLIYIQIMKTGYEEFGQSYTMPASDGSFYANLKIDNNI